MTQSNLNMPIRKQPDTQIHSRRCLCEENLALQSTFKVSSTDRNQRYIRVFTETADICSYCDKVSRFY